MFLTANKIHDGNRWLPEGTVIEVSPDGVILSVQEGNHPETVFCKGILTPGFVNAHCHLELSHMKGLIGEHTGLIPFLKNIPQHRNDFTDEQKKTARHAACDELVRNGIVAVGDIANTADAIDIRDRDVLHIHTFVEALGFDESRAATSFGYAADTWNAYNVQPIKDKQLRQTIVPHAPYSVSGALFHLIDGHSEGSLISIHNQESDDEDIYFRKKEGRVPELLRVFNIDDGAFVPSGKSSLQTYLQWMSPQHPMIFVHNTRTTRDDVQFAHSKMSEAYWCLCPNANLYIENRLPDIDMLISEGAQICIGTDSLASNHQLSILSELVTIKQHFNYISWNVLLQWATANGAAALRMDEVVGTIAPGKAPGILQITGIDDGSTPEVQRIV